MTASDRARFADAIVAFDVRNGEDPNREQHAGRDYPKELLYAERMTVWLERLEPDASEVLRLAVRSQHLCRWRIARRDYPSGRQGYLAWRRACAEMHGALAGEILSEVGYDDGTIARVQDLLRKRRLKLDPEVQLLEDVACLVFLESYLADFARQHDDDKLIEILRKTWRKMSRRGQAAAGELLLPAELRRLIEKALAVD